MSFKLKYSQTAEMHLMNLKNDPSKRRILKDVIKALRYMEVDLRHPSLNTHEYHTLQGPNGEKIFEAYAQQKTPGAYRNKHKWNPSILSITSKTQDEISMNLYPKTLFKSYAKCIVR
jgi:hypothetical protein